MLFGSLGKHVLEPPLQAEHVWPMRGKTVLAIKSTMLRARDLSLSKTGRGATVGRPNDIDCLERPRKIPHGAFTHNISNVTDKGARSNFLSSTSGSSSIQSRSIDIDSGETTLSNPS